MRSYICSITDILLRSFFFEEIYGFRSFWNTPLTPLSLKHVHIFSQVLIPELPRKWIEHLNDRPYLIPYLINPSRNPFKPL